MCVFLSARDSSRSPSLAACKIPSTLRFLQEVSGGFKIALWHKLVDTKSSRNSRSAVHKRPFADIAVTPPVLRLSSFASAHGKASDPKSRSLSPFVYSLKAANFEKPYGYMDSLAVLNLIS